MTMQFLICLDERVKSEDEVLCFLHREFLAVKKDGGRGDFKDEWRKKSRIKRSGLHMPNESVHMLGPTQQLSAPLSAKVGFRGCLKALKNTL